MDIECTFMVFVPSQTSSPLTLPAHTDRICLGINSPPRTPKFTFSPSAIDFLQLNYPTFQTFAFQQTLFLSKWLLLRSRTVPLSRVCQRTFLLSSIFSHTNMFFSSCSRWWLCGHVNFLHDIIPHQPVPSFLSIKMIA